MLRWTSSLSGPRSLPSVGVGSDAGEVIGMGTSTSTATASEIPVASPLGVAEPEDSDTMGQVSDLVRNSESWFLRITSRIKAAVGKRSPQEKARRMGERAKVRAAKRFEADSKRLPDRP